MEFSLIVFGALTIISACGVVLSRKTLNSALWLVATLFLVAVHFAMMGADFIAALQVLIYAGAIMVLVVFVIMLLGIDEEAEAPYRSVMQYVSAVVSALFVGVLLVAFNSGMVIPYAKRFSGQPMPGGATEVGKLLITRYVYPFEIAALLLLAAVIGAVILSYEGRRPLQPGRGLRAMQRKEEQNLPEAEAQP